ncbi:GTP-dependent dephospho-CoA kinase family protein [Candidatus Micrarchaeota archaeon]|nr:GTP-dependent dephospho-CoA kinase family protein [Candidatus Micrarchaeota archaeon]
MPDKLITPQMRISLKNPLGKLLSAKQALLELGENGKIVAVGDITTLFLLKNGILPDVCFIDYVCKRRKISASQKRQLVQFKARIVRVRNPAGRISAQLVNACRSIFQSGKNEFVKVIVNGEEDLAVIAVCLFAKIGTRIVYGQPGKGIVLIKQSKKSLGLAKWYYKNSVGI